MPRGAQRGVWNTMQRWLNNWWRWVMGSLSTYELLR